ncbi:lipid II flippase MurJ [Streptomyces sp. NPDC085946]|uniref:murein biosynthesis integral membrane protein MurJ n=1 Tax=Streptomyces sp. NPDC085946 TaxID=3365744 RepID=UPI0037CD1B19
MTVTPPRAAGTPQEPPVAEGEADAPRRLPGPGDRTGAGRRPPVSGEPAGPRLPARGDRAGRRPSPAGEPTGRQLPASEDHAGLAPRGFLARATLVTAVLSVAGAVLGLARDQALARLFGAGRETDAFLVAWTVPEFAATLLIEDGLAFALIPAFSLALARRARGAPGDPVRALVARTLPRLLLAFAAASALIAAAAPYLVEALAPGLPDPALAVDCTRLTATSVLSFGLAGYCSAALRAHRRFLAPAAIYVAYNTALIAVMLAFGGRWGVRAAAAGVAAGGCLMVLAQLPSLGRQMRRKAPAGPGGGDGDRAMGLAVLSTVLLFALCRQSQVLVERFLGSALPSGAISHLNYAQKVAQIPMTLSLMLCTVTFPVVARALAEGDTGRARARVERDLALAASLVLLGTAGVVACAPQLVELLFQRGAFTGTDTAATAGVMRVYALGLLAQTLVGALVRSYFSAGRPTWYPLAAMAAGLAVTAWLGAWTVGFWGVSGIAAANAAGITVTAALLLAGTNTGRGGPRAVPVRTRRVLAEVGRPVPAAAAAALAGAGAAGLADAPLPGLAAGSAAVLAVFVLLGRCLGDQGCVLALRSLRALRTGSFRFLRSPRSPRSVTRKAPHGDIR